MIKRFALAIALACLASLSAFAAKNELLSGTLKLVVYSDTGGFSLYRLSPVGKNRYEPLFDDRNYSSTSWFSVLAGGRIFALVPKAGRKPEVLADGSSIRVTFTPTDDFQVVQTFSFADSGEGSSPTLSISTAVENTSGKAGEFAVKALIDTDLGEDNGIHFRTDFQARLSAETSLDPVVNRDSWIASAGKDSSLVFPFASWPVKPERIVIANWERLKTLSWIPSTVEGRSFNTVYSVNDSALLFVWPMANLSPNKTLTVTMTLGDKMPTAKASPSGVRATDAATELTSPGRTRNEVIEGILARIAEIEQNPNSASDTELEQLNALLDKYLSDTGAQ